MSALRRILRDPVATLGLLLVLFAALVAIFAPWLAPYPDDAFDSHLLQRLQPPSAAFPFGTDNLGRDILSRVILGTRSAITVAVSVVGGAIIERTLIRPVGSDNVLAIVIVTIGIFIATNALAGWIYGTDGRVFPRIFPNESLVTFGDVTVTKETTGIVAILLVVVGLLYLLFQHT